MDIIQQYDIKYLYHMTSINNLESIVRSGLLSHNEVYRRGLRKVDISDPDVQGRRATRTVYDLSLHEYVPLYFCPRNPMLHKRKEIQEDIVLIGIDPMLLIGPNVVFSDGNAASAQTRFYKDVQKLNQLPWNVIWSQWWGDFEDGKRQKCSEILVRPSIQPSKIRSLFCRSEKHCGQILAITHGTDIMVWVNPDMYF